MSPALEGGFLTPGPPEESLSCLCCLRNCLRFWLCSIMYALIVTLTLSVTCDTFFLSVINLIWVYFETLPFKWGMVCWH